jgi:hypothetical protein
MIRCYRCGTDNLEGSEFCDECGTRLVRNDAAPLPPPPQFNREPVTPKPATPYTPPHSSPPPLVRTGADWLPLPGTGDRVVRAVSPGEPHPGQPETATPTGPRPSAPPTGGVIAWLIVQRAGRNGREFALPVETELMIGRWDADSGIFPDIDLDLDDPEAKVSRRHARITYSNHQYLIEDLGSTNGTFINRGPRLLPGNRQPLNHGDEIIVGKTFLRFLIR